MTFEETKAAVLSLNDNDQKRLIVEVLPEILPKVCTDEVCLSPIRNFINDETIKTYQEQHMGGI